MSHATRFRLQGSHFETNLVPAPVSQLDTRAANFLDSN
jgi:hypothetical protein